MTTSYNVEIVLALDGPIDGEVEAHLDDVAEAFQDITDVDGDVGYDVSTGRVDLCMTVLAADRSDAVGRAISAARTAIHTAGGGTAGWDGLLQKAMESDEFRSSVAPSSLGIRLDDCPA